MRSYETGDRFFRPMDVQVTRRNYRRVQARRLISVMANLLLLALLIIAAYWMWQKTQSDERFSIRDFRIAGARHTSESAVREVVAGYTGRNLFQTDLEEVSRALTALPWVQSVAIEKELPSTLVVHVTERVPVALVRTGGVHRYVGADGIPFSELSPKFGNGELPVIRDAEGPALKQCVDMLLGLREGEPGLYSRLSEIAPAQGEGFRIYDRDLDTVVYLSAEDGAEKWKVLHSIVRAEGEKLPPLEYADLRFADRVVVMPSAPMQLATDLVEKKENGAADAVPVLGE